MCSINGEIGSATQRIGDIHRKRSRGTLSPSCLYVLESENRAEHSRDSLRTALSSIVYATVTKCAHTDLKKEVFTSLIGQVNPMIQPRRCIWLTQSLPGRAARVEGDRNGLQKRLVRNETPIRRCVKWFQRWKCKKTDVSVGCCEATENILPSFKLITIKQMRAMFCRSHNTWYRRVDSYKRLRTGRLFRMAGRLTQCFPCIFVQLIVSLLWSQTMAIARKLFDFYSCGLLRVVEKYIHNLAYGFGV